MNSILVVCEGNVCRSPMAEGIFAALAPWARVRSAGVRALIGMPADDTAIKLMRERGIDISAHRAAQILDSVCASADLILVMSRDQREWIGNMYPQVRGRVFRLGHFADFDVVDPVGRPESVFRKSLDQISAGAQEWVARIEKVRRSA